MAAVDTGWRIDNSLGDGVLKQATGAVVIDKIFEADITLADNTTDNVSSTKHGFAPKSPADATTFLNGAATPAYAQVKDSDLSTTDITTNNFTSSKHGFAPKSPADATQFLNGAATPAFASVKDSDLSTSDITTNNVSITKHGFTPKLPNDAAKYLDGTGAFSVPAGGGGGSSYLTLCVPFQQAGIMNHSEAGTGSITYGAGGIKQTTGATSNSNSWTHAGLDDAGNDDLGGHAMRFHARCRISTSGSDYAAYIGIGKVNENNNPFGSADRWIGIKIERAASGTATVKGTTNNNSTETTTTLSSVTETSFFDLGIDITSSSATFYINGVNKGSVSANFPANIYYYYCSGISNIGVAGSSALTTIAASLEVFSY